MLSLSKDVPLFASEFVRRMREHPNVLSKPSPRQAISISRLLSSKRLHIGALGIEDLILAAVVTSYPENQVVAYQVAKEILCGKEEPRKTKEGEDSFKIEKPDKNYFGYGGLHQPGGKTLLKRGDFGTGVGAGEELFREWYARFKDRKYKRGLRKIAERIRIGSDSKSDHIFHTKEESGSLEGSKLSYFQAGEDTDLIDFEESIENIISQQKKSSEIKYEDLIVRERRGLRKAVVFLFDISGSMKDALRDSVVSTTILLYALRKHEIAFAFFEGDAYIIKEFFDKKPIDDVIEEILSARSMFGTMAANVFEWGKKQLKRIDGRCYQRECIVLSDLGFFDVREVVGKIKDLINMDVRVVFILPPTFIYKSNLELVKDCTIVGLGRNLAELSRMVEAI